MNAHLIRRTGMAVAVAVAVMGLAGAAVTIADPTDETVAVASLLQAGDVFAGSTTSGVTIGTADDLPGFVANGGIRQASQTWTTTEPAGLIFDFRFQFPDEASAVAFLDASESALSEVANGLAAAPLLDPPLPDTRFYTVTVPSAGVEFNYLMHTGNLVAKVFIGASGDVPQSTADAIAQAAASRMTAALAAASESESPSSGTETGAPSASPLESPTVTPSEAPPGTPLPSPDPTVVATLIATVPASIAPTCAPLLFTPEKPPRDGELARVGCIATNGAGISLSAFDSADSVNSAFSAGELVAQLFGQLSASGTCEGGGYDATWTADGTPAGNLLCYSLEGASVIDWSDPTHLLLGSINQALGDPAAAFEAWVEAGNGVRAPAN